MTHIPEKYRQQSRRSAPSGPDRQLPLDRVVGWVLFFAIIALSVAAFAVKPGSGGIDDVAARDVGGPFGDASAVTQAGGATEPGDSSTADDSTDDGSAQPTDPGAEADADAGNDEAASPADTTITVAFTGDVLVHESVAESARTDSGYDFAPQFGDVAPILEAADLAICHLETPISSDNSTLAYYPTFIVPSQLADGIDRAGFHGCSVASNHSLDAGEAGVRSTTTELTRVALGFAGVAGPSEVRGRLTNYTVDGTTIGHISYTYGFNGLEPTGRNAELANVLDLETIARDAAETRANGANFVVVSAHWGDEFSIGLSDYQATLGPQIADLADVDLVIGHHAHVVQQVSQVNGKYVAYGLGNFLSNQGPDPDSCPSCPPESQDGVILLVDIDSNGGTPQVTGVRAVPTWVDRANGHVIRVLRQGDDGERGASYQRTAAALRGDGVDVTIAE